MPSPPRPVSRRPVTLLLLPLLGLLSLLALLSGCTTSPANPTTPPTAGQPTASQPAASQPTATADASPALVLPITIKAGQVSPNGVKINVRQGQTVVLQVTSDADDEVHAHTGGDGYELEVKAGVPSTGRFVAVDTGSFEVESHHLGKIIAILVVR